MSKKLLNESTIRRFGGLAGIKPTIVSNFIQESEYLDAGIVAEEDELDALEDDSIADAEVDDLDATADAEADMDDAIEDAGEAEEEMADAALDAELDAEAEGEETAEAIVQGIVDSLQQLAALAGVDMDVESPDEEIVDMSLDDDGIDLDVEETLEEMLNGILGEEAREEADVDEYRKGVETGRREEKDDLEEEKDPDWGGNTGDFKRRKNAKGVRKKVGDEDHHYKDYEKKNEALVQEVLKRVKTRLTKLSAATK